MTTRGRIRYDVTARTAQFTTAMAGVNSSLLGMQRTMSSVALAGTASLGGLFGGAILLQGVKTLATFERQMSKVAAISGAGADEIKELTDNARELGRTTRFTASQVAGLEVEFSKLGFTAEQIIGLSDATLRLASVADTDLANAARVAGETMRGFSLDVSESQRVVDVLATAFSNSALDIEKWSAGMANVAPIATALGLSLERVTSMFAALVNAGTDASKATTDLRTIFILAKQNGIELADAFEQIRKSTDPVTLAVELFQRRAAASAVILSKLTGEMGDFEDVLLDSEGAAKAMADIMEDNLIGDFFKLKSAIEGVVLEADEGANALRRLTQAATELIDSFRETPEEELIRIGEEIATIQTQLSEGKNLLFFDLTKRQAFELEQQLLKLLDVQRTLQGAGDPAADQISQRGLTFLPPALRGFEIDTSKVLDIPRLTEAQALYLSMTEAAESWLATQEEINASFTETLSLMEPLADEAIEDIKISTEEWNDGMMQVQLTLLTINSILGITGEKMSGLSKVLRFLLVGLNIAQSIGSIINPVAGLGGLFKSSSVTKAVGADIVTATTNTVSLRKGVGVIG